MNTQDTIHRLFEAHVEQRPDNIALIFAGQTLNYFALNEKANQFAYYLQEMGVKEGSQVALCMERSIDLIITVLGILKAGCAYVPLDLSHPRERSLFTLADSNTSILITKTVVKENFVDYQGKIIVLDNEEKEINKRPTHNLNSAITSQQLAYVIYTSGSTGKPKGILIEHKSVVNYGLWFADYCHCQPQQLIDFSANYIFDMAISTSIVPLMLGLTVVICSDEAKRNARHYLNYLAYNKVNTIKTTPSYFKLLLHEVKNNITALPHLQNVILGGESLSTTDCASWLTRYPKHILFNEYGPTEATVAVTQYKIHNANLSSLGVNVPIGKPGPNMDCHILTPDNMPVSDGESGELCVGGACLARGYLNQPELTQKQFIKNPFSNTAKARLYKTGDLCRRLPDGTIEYLGRIDRQVKIRGFRIELGEVEKCLTTHPAIHDVRVLVREEPLHEKRLIAYYIPKDIDTTPNTSQLRQYLRAYLPDYMLPTAFVSINAFPLTRNGKLDEAALPVPQFISSQDYQAPRTTLEKTLTAIWSEELGIKSIGLEYDFFELGGHSLSAARIISKINKTLRKDITISDFYNALTIAKLVPIVIQAKITDEINISANKDLYDDLTPLPLSDFQFMLWIANIFEPKAKKLNITVRKRMQGQLDVTQLNFAFETVLKKHEILHYRIFKFRPIQLVQKNLPFKIVEKNIASLSEKESELVLETSANELIHHYPWHKDAPLLLARLFHMKDEITELQICMSHLISDAVCSEILLSDLSKLYLFYNTQTNIDMVRTDKGYRDYLFNEQYYLQVHLERDLVFWEEYLKNASLFAFPKENVVKDMEYLGISYSTYLEIPEKRLNNLQQFCAQNHVSINDGLCATLALALSNYCDNYNDGKQTIFMNIVKSTRDNQRYDDTIGCFLRLEPIKITISKQSTLIGLCKEIHQSAIDTNPYQRCSSIVKLACIGIFRKNIIRNHLIKVATYIYTILFRIPALNRKIFNLSGRLSSFKRNNEFLININVQNNFVPTSNKRKKTPNLFGLKTKNITIKPYDLLNIDSFFDVCFIRDENQNIPYLVISANLKPLFRELIAQEMIRIIVSEPFDSK